MQNIAAVITLVLLIGFSFIFLKIIDSSVDGEASAQSHAGKAYKLRSKIFWLILVIGVVVTVFTLTPWPHKSDAGPINNRIEAKARQWAWSLSEDKVKVGQTIEFLVTAEDVTHAFALYDPEQKMVAQVQAMPGFVNKVRYQFTKAGTYKILCLEYCALAHHGMVAEIQASP